MANLNFEVNLNGMFQVQNGDVVLTELSDGGGGIFPPAGPFDPVASNMIVQTDQSLLVKFNWRVKGALALMMAGKWECAVYLEEMGPGEYPNNHAQTTPLVASIDHTYNVYVSIPPIAKAGLYKIYTAVSLVGPAPSNVALPVSALAEIGLLRTYDAA
jgi:hypothetical protein